MICMWLLLLLLFFLSYSFGFLCAGVAFVSVFLCCALLLLHRYKSAQFSGHFIYLCAIHLNSVKYCAVIVAAMPPPTASLPN